MTNEKKMMWTKKDLLGLEYLSREEIEHILYTAASFKEVTTRQIKKVPALRGKTVTMELTVLEVKKLELPELTADLLAELGAFETVDELRVAFRKQLENQLEWHRRRQVRQQVASALTASATWDLPPDLLRRQSQRELERSILSCGAAASMTIRSGAMSTNSARR